MNIDSFDKKLFVFLFKCISFFECSDIVWCSNVIILILLFKIVIFVGDFRVFIISSLSLLRGYYVILWVIILCFFVDVLMFLVRYIVGVLLFFLNFLCYVFYNCWCLYFLLIIGRILVLFYVFYCVLKYGVEVFFDVLW